MDGGDDKDFISVSLPKLSDVQFCPWSYPSSGATSSCHGNRHQECSPFLHLLSLVLFEHSPKGSRVLRPQQNKGKIKPHAQIATMYSTFTYIKLSLALSKQKIPILSTHSWLAMHKAHYLFLHGEEGRQCYRNFYSCISCCIPLFFNLYNQI